MGDKATDEAEKLGGILDLYSDKFIGLYTAHRSVLIEMLLDGDRDRSYPVLKISMPCGYDYTFEKREDLPWKTLFCMCGDPKHIVIKYEVEE